MMPIHTLFLAALALVPLPPPDEEPAPGELAVMTFNLRYASDRKPNSWQERRDATVELIRGERPDLIGTQEALFEQVRDIESGLPQYRWVGQGRNGGSHGEFMAIFYLKERLELLEYDHFWLSETPNVVGSLCYDASLPRMVTWAVFRDLNTKRTFTVLNTHFDHASHSAREKSARQIMEWVKSIEIDRPLLLIGDFNAPAQSGGMYDFLVGEDLFTDSFTSAKVPGTDHGTFHGFTGRALASTRIDWILHRGPIAVSASKIVTFQKDGQFPSDHFPVLARLRLM